MGFLFLKEKFKGVILNLKLFKDRTVMLCFHRFVFIAREGIHDLLLGALKHVLKIVQLLFTKKAITHKWNNSIPSFIKDCVLTRQMVWQHYKLNCHSLYTTSLITIACISQPENSIHFPRNLGSICPRHYQVERDVLF